MVLLMLAACGTQTPEAEGLSTQAAARTYYVATNGKDTNSGTTASAPLATIGAAVDKAQSSRSQGSVDVVVAAGAYRQTVDDTTSSSGPLITVKGAGATLSGSDVYPKAEWTNEGGGLWSHRWDNNWTPTKVDSHSSIMAQRRECVFHNGQLLRQLETNKPLTNNTFKVDETANKLYIKVSTFGTVEVCTRDTLWKLSQTRNLRVEGLTFQHAASTFSNPAVVAYSGQTFDGVTVQWNGQAGLKLQGNDSGVAIDTDPDAPATHTDACDLNGQCDIIVRNSHLNDNGFSGLTGFGVRNSLVEDSAWSRNNWRGNWWGHHGWDTGNKILHVRGLILRRNTVEDNFSSGWWCDTNCMNVRLYDNTFRGNRVGVNLELSQGPFEVHDNTFVGNTYPDPAYPNHGSGTTYDVNCSSTDRCHIVNNAMDGVLQVTQASRCYQIKDVICNKDVNTFMQNPFNLADNYYPHSLGFIVTGNDYRQVLFEFMDDCELAVTRTGTLRPPACTSQQISDKHLDKDEGVQNGGAVWRDNDNPGPPDGPSNIATSDKKVRLIRNSGNPPQPYDIFRSETDFKVEFFEPDWTAFD